MAINYYIRGGAAILSGIGLAVQLALPNHALGDDPYRVAKTPTASTRYEDTNLASLGVPNWEGLRAEKTIMLDKNPNIPGKETTQDVYRINGAMVGVKSFNNKIYSVSLDKDWLFPLDYSFLDSTGAGNFVSINPRENYEVPKWVIK